MGGKRTKPFRKPLSRQLIAFPVGNPKLLGSQHIFYCFVTARPVALKQSPSAAADRVHHHLSFSSKRFSPQYLFQWKFIFRYRGVRGWCMHACIHITGCFTVCDSVCVCMCTRACVCVCARARACVRVVPLLWKSLWRQNRNHWPVKGQSYVRVAGNLHGLAWLAAIRVEGCRDSTKRRMHNGALQTYPHVERSALVFVVVICFLFVFNQARAAQSSTVLAKG